jgi:hypothetical protein
MHKNKGRDRSKSWRRFLKKIDKSYKLEERRKEREEVELMLLKQKLQEPLSPPPSRMKVEPL